MDYRREIDGLRSLAVLPVILSHAGVSLFAGGFVGVDVFFVISGYLITSILIIELQGGTYSLLRFYERRARRILPALFIVILACMPFAWLWMRPDQMAEFGKSVVAVILFVSNILFWREDGYFEAPAALKPLLHTWSLAVEEQYYLLFPLLLAFLWPLGRKRVFWILLAMSGISLLLTEWGWRNKPVANFYLAPTRAWELLAGSLCAFGPQVLAGFRGRGAMAALGLGLVLWAIFTFDETLPFPSLWTLAPVLGTVLIILGAGPGTWVQRLLALPPFVGIGLISYSAYLWHQPLFAFARLRFAAEPPTALMLVLGAASLVLAWASWRFVEQPFRRKTLPVLASRRSVFLASGVAATTLALAGGVAVLSEGLPQRLSPVARAAAEAGETITFNCGELAYCWIGAQDGAPISVAFVGDSHMGRYALAFNQILAETGRKAQLVTQGYCAPLLDFATQDPRKNIEKCNVEFPKAFQAVLDDPSVTAVVLAAQWAHYTSGWRAFDVTSAYDFAGDGQVNDDPESNPAEFDRALAATFAALKARGKTIYVIEPAPEYEVDVPSAVIQRLMLGLDLAPLRLPRDLYDARTANVRESFDKLRDQAIWIRPQEALCNTEFCLPFDDRKLPLYNDGSHLSGEGLDLVMPMILKALNL